MTCKDCIGYEFCSIGRDEDTVFYGKDIACNDVEDLCRYFKNKADFVKVVRCKDCKQFSENIEGTRPIEGADGKCFIRMVHSIDTQYCGVCYDDYCSYGERKVQE